MLLTGFDCKYLNTLYVDKNLKHHGLIQAFSRTNRVLNATKPYGHILDFRGQQDASTPPSPSSPAPRPTGPRDLARRQGPRRHREAQGRQCSELDDFMKSQGLDAKPEDVANLKGDDARAAFIKHFKEVQRLQTQLDQYTDLTDEQKADHRAGPAQGRANAFRGAYLETAQRLQGAAGQAGGDDESEPRGRPARLRVRPLRLGPHRLRLHHGADRRLLDARSPSKATMSREQLIGLIAADAKFLDERDDITEYVRS